MAAWRTWGGFWIGLTLLGVPAVAAPPATFDRAADARQFEEQIGPLLTGLEMQA